MQMAHNQHNLDDIDTESLHIHVLEDNFILLESVADVKFINLQHIEIVFMVGDCGPPSSERQESPFPSVCVPAVRWSCGRLAAQGYPSIQLHVPLLRHDVGP